MASREQEQAIRRLLDAHALPWRFSRRRKHRSVLVDHEGATHEFIFPGSGSDSRRGPLNAVAFIRRRLGLRRQQS